MEVVVVALVLDVDQLAQHAVALDGLALLEKGQHLEVDLGLAQAIDARDRGDDQDVVALEQGLGGRVAQLVDLVVDAGVLLDVGVGGGNVGLGLVVVVVGDEVADRVVREQALELVVELGGERLVGRDHQRRLVHVGDHVGHREGLARAGDAEQHLLAHAVAHVAGQRLDRGGLIALRTIAGDQPEDPFFAARQREHNTSLAGSPGCPRPAIGWPPEHANGGHSDHHIITTSIPGRRLSSRVPLAARAGHGAMNGRSYPQRPCRGCDRPLAFVPQPPTRDVTWITCADRCAIMMRHHGITASNRALLKSSDRRELAHQHRSRGAEPANSNGLSARQIIAMDLKNYI